MEETFVYGNKEISLETTELTEESIQEKIEEYKEKIDQINPFPRIGTEFIINDQLFRIHYINEGKHRFSAIWIDDKRGPLIMPVLGSTCLINGITFRTTYVDEKRKRITIEPEERV